MKHTISLLSLLVAVGSFGCSSSDSSSPSLTDASADSSADSAVSDSSANDADSLSDTQAENKAPQTHTIEVGLAGLSFTPATITIRVGDTIHWNFNGSHNVVSGTSCTADNKFCSPANADCANAMLMAPGDSYDHAFTEAGDFPYFCIPHCAMGMTGTITVTP